MLLAGEVAETPVDRFIEIKLRADHDNVYTSRPVTVKSRGRERLPGAERYAVSRYTRAAVSWNSAAFSADEYPAASRLNAFHRTP
jgi:hypothetical protein